MPQQGYFAVLAADLADGTQILNSASETIICPDYSFAANDPLIRVGTVLRSTCYFDISNPATPGTLTFRLRWGGVGGTALATSGAYAADPTSITTPRSGWIEHVIVVRTIGSAGSMFAMGRMGINDVDDASATSLKGNLEMFTIPTNAPAAVGSLDTTTAKLLSVTAQFSSATATVQLTNHIRILESLA